MKISINNKWFEAKEKETVLQVALRNGIYIPHLCYHTRTGKAASCRTCVVEDEKTGKLVTSCNYEVQDGMQIITESKKVKTSQRYVVDMVLSSGDHNCLTCEANGDCELQDAAYYLGIRSASFPLYDGIHQIDESSEFLVIDRSRCINCGRCIAACNNNVVNETLAKSNRGFETKIIFDSDLLMGESSCVQCGECYQVCPVGAIIDKRTRGKRRNWNIKEIKTTCNYCGVGCQLNVKVDQITGKVVEITGVEDSITNEGMLCVKGRFGFDFAASNERLKFPLIKENGKFRKASWNEALELISNKFLEIKNNFGSDAIAGFTSAKTTNEENYLFQKFMRREVGTNNVDHCARL
jgi:formate dehydrogenase major subunit